MTQTAKPIQSAHRHKTTLRQQRRKNFRALVEMSRQSDPAAQVARKVRGLVGFFGGEHSFVRISGFSFRSIANYKTGKQPIRPIVVRRISELENLKSALASIMKPQTVPTWLQQPNPLFDGLKPVEVIERGETHKLWRMIHLTESGSPS